MHLTSILPWKNDKRSLARWTEDGDPLTQLQRQMNSLFDDFLVVHLGIYGVETLERSSRERMSAKLTKRFGSLPSCRVSTRRT